MCIISDVIFGGLSFAQAKRQVVQPVYQVTPGAANVQVITPNPAVSQYYETLENALVNLAGELV